MRLKNVKGANEIIEKGTYFISNPTNYKGNWASVFENNNPINIEIGRKTCFVLRKKKKLRFL